MNEYKLMDDLLRHRLETLSVKIPELELAFQGNELILNVCVAYSRKVAAENVLLKERLDKAEAEIELHQTELSALRLQCEENQKRLDKASEWLKTKGMK